ncbi:hypothetical protein ACFQ3P_13940 [Paraburkholderia sabiae]|uniref:Cysteine-rich CPCC domain-containing protein n=1 Tax=Paraburkholderia sabiae TaxID=273251 RepID=A0ABU9QL01_9BURK|nr:hypothetical protein [Paraburkholderia sabiae]WJZ76201.1 hypothetical protein QEN71_10480 [Paraburkholderia sabiae]
MNERLKVHAGNVKKPKCCISEIHNTRCCDYCGFIQTVFPSRLFCSLKAVDCLWCTNIEGLYRNDSTVSSFDREYCGNNDNELHLAGFIVSRNALEFVPFHPVCTQQTTRLNAALSAAFFFVCAYMNDRV